MKIGVTSNALWLFAFQAAVREEMRHFEDMLFSILLIKRNSVLLQREGIHFFCLSISFIFFLNRVKRQACNQRLCVVNGIGHCF